MTDHCSSRRIFFFATGVSLLSGFLPLQAQWWPFGKDDKTPVQNGEGLKLDSTPVGTAGPAITSFAPIVKKISPSVVSVFTTKKVHPAARNFPMLNDPFFRHFFGDPDGGDGNGEQPSRSPHQQPQHLPDQTQTGLGSGVIVTKDGYILTNNHVIEVADEIQVELSSSRHRYPAKLVGKDPMTDVALIKIEANDLTPMVIADSDKTEVGDVVLAIGSPFGLAQTVTMGIISAKGRNDMHIEQYEDFIQTDAAINPGNSGGALVDVQGRMIGLNTAILGGGGGNVGIGFAVPSNLARYVMESLHKDGHVTRGYLGVSIQEVTSELAEQFKLPEITGALVSEVNKGTAASIAGFEDEDIILEFNGRKIPDCSTLRLMVAQTPPDTKCSVKVWRDAKEKMLDVTLKELTPDILGANKKESDEPDQSQPDAPVTKSLVEGVKIDELTDDVRHQFNIPANVKGVIVVDIDPDALAIKPGGASLQVGDVVTEVAKRPVTTVKEAMDAVKQTSGNLLVRVWSRGATKEGSYRFFVIPHGGK